jgi:hypothetical protein
VRWAVVLAVGAAFASVIATARPSFADAAPPFVPGDPVGVPWGPVSKVFIAHEDLSMDLSSLNPSDGTTNPRATVVATYTLRNDGAAKGIDLVFITASQTVRGVQVDLDGSPVTATVGPLGRVPPSWMPPAGTPDPQGGADLPYEVDRAAGLTFHIDLGAGTHTMTTSYQAVPGRNSGDAAENEPVWWQLAFVLSPARQWEGFGDLSLQVRVPHSWSAAVRPSLSRTGDTLSGHFDGIPADSIAVTTRMPLPPDYRGITWRDGLVALVILCLIAGIAGARLLPWPYGLLFLLAAPDFGLALAIAVGFEEGLRAASLPAAQQSWFGSRSVGIMSALQAPFAFVAGSALGLFALSVGITAGAIWRWRRRRTAG